MEGQYDKNDADLISAITDTFKTWWSSFLSEDKGNTEVCEGYFRDGSLLSWFSENIFEIMKYYSAHERERVGEFLVFHSYQEGEKKTLAFLPKVEKEKSGDNPLAIDYASDDTRKAFYSESKERPPRNDAATSYVDGGSYQVDHGEVEIKINISFRRNSDE